MWKNRENCHLKSDLYAYKYFRDQIIPGMFLIQHMQMKD